MFRSQQQCLDSVRSQRYLFQQSRNPLLQRHPVLLPTAFLSGSLLSGIAGLYGNMDFTVIGASSLLLCLLVAFVLGTCGLLICIIGILEYNELQWGVQVVKIAHTTHGQQSKEHSYDRY
ncbi:hypothetical protein [Tengunoibacter tsumagoiensis]|uniref:Uncharacterized protein n=1 Tax=Tengunoibacter tsumagoiensis TaxID=2014871 RepID=A0A402A304_9CHLR|nr:hypothetical protein [Tengunoibacter tsumagoiensis]GCE13391.1 hypothetical protein KTT_32500 [Tengunoibacter tsumagoiensis]